MKTMFLLPVATLALTLVHGPVAGGVLDPDCTAEKAAKGAAMKATIGVHGRCSPAEAAKDTAGHALGIEKKGPLEKKHHKEHEGIGEKLKHKADD